VTGRLIGDLALIEPGCEVYSRRRRVAASTDDVAGGGIVIDAYDRTDPDTGEIVKVFVCVDAYRDRIRAWHIDEDEVDRTAVVGPDPTKIRRLIRTAGRAVCDHMAGRNHGNPLTTAEVTAARTIAVLVALQMPGVEARLADWRDSQPAKVYEDRPTAPLNVSAMVD
jgi:hypothetical protein